MKHLPAVRIENHSGFHRPLTGLVPVLRQGYYHRIDIPVSGDAPKDFIRVYEYGEGVFRSKKNSWPMYIAKVGHKWYPVESITEHLLNRIGEVIGMQMAASRIVMIGNQLRFLSRYFLKKDESLVHGAEIFAGYIGNKHLAEFIENLGLARTFFTFQFAEKAIISVFPHHAENILQDFVKMLVFDAITGNNDRHFYNWGVITHAKDKREPCFSPIYDTARGLFWNDSEDKIKGYLKDKKQLPGRLKKYAEGSRPKTGWEGMTGNINHFELVKMLYDDVRYRDTCDRLLRNVDMKRIGALLDDEFREILSPERKVLIMLCLETRLEILKNIVNLQ